MAKRPPCPSNMPWITPYLIVRDAQAAIAFYEKAFNFKLRDAMKDDKGVIIHAEMSYENALIMLGPEGPKAGPMQSPKTSGVASPVSIYVYCEDVDYLHQQAVKAGAKSIEAPTTMFWGDRMCRLEDRDGHAWGFATNIAEFDPSKIPQS